MHTSCLTKKAGPWWGIRAVGQARHLSLQPPTIAVHSKPVLISVHSRHLSEQLASVTDRARSFQRPSLCKLFSFLSSVPYRLAARLAVSAQGRSIFAEN